MATAAELRALADKLDVIEEAEAAAAAAKAAYQANPGDAKLKAAHRKASTAFADARQEMRAEAKQVVDASPGSVTIMPATVSTTKEG